MTLPARLPLGVAVGTDETLASHLSRTALRNGLGRAAVEAVLDVTPTDPLRALSRSQIRRAASLTGLGVDVIEDMLPSRYPRAVTGEIEGRGKVQHRGPGLLILEPARVCDECLVEEAGVIRVSWLLGTAVVCLEHNRVLSPTCRHCHPGFGYLSFAKHSRIPHRDCSVGALSLDSLGAPPLASAPDLEVQVLLDEWLDASRTSTRAAERLESLTHALRDGSARSWAPDPESALQAWSWELDGAWKAHILTDRSPSAVGAHARRSGRPALDPAVTLARLPDAVRSVTRLTQPVPWLASLLRQRARTAAGDAAAELRAAAFEVRHLPSSLDASDLAHLPGRPWTVGVAMALTLAWAVGDESLSRTCRSIGLIPSDHTFVSKILQRPGDEHSAVPSALLRAARCLIDAGPIDYAGRRDALWGLTDVPAHVWQTSRSVVIDGDTRTAAALAWSRTTGGPEQRSPAFALRTHRALRVDRIVDDFVRRHGAESVAQLDIYAENLLAPDVQAASTFVSRAV